MFAILWGLQLQENAIRINLGTGSVPTSDVYLTRDMEGVKCLMDNILLFAATLTKLQKITKNVNIKLKNAALKLNRQKCIFQEQQVKFLRRILQVKFDKQ